MRTFAATVTACFFALIAGFVLAACAHHAPAQPNQSPNEDWSRGLAGRSVTAAPLAARPADRVLFEKIKIMQEKHQFASPEASSELAPLLSDASQVMLGATGPALFRQGVYSGSPGLMNSACAAIRRVENPALRRTNSLADYEKACNVLEAPSSALSGRACGNAAVKMVEAVNTLALDEQRARAASAAGLRAWRDCPEARALRRTPINPASPGFIIVVAMEFFDLPPSTFLAGEPAPNTIATIDDSFIASVNALR